MSTISRSSELARGGQKLAKKISDVEDRVITIVVESMDNVRSGGQDVMVLVEFAQGLLLGESDKIRCAEEGPTAVRLRVPLHCNPTDPESLDELVAHPVLFTIIEVVPKLEGKKGAVKEETTQVLGRCNLDLLPLVLGETRVSEVLLVEQDKRAVAQEVVTWPNLPRLAVSASVPERLLSPGFVKESNLLHFTLESLYHALPRMTDQLTYQAATLLPPGITKSPCREFRFESGERMDRPDMDNAKRWFGLHHVQGRGALSAYRMTEDFTGVGIPLEEAATAARVQWNALRRCWVTRKEADALYGHLARRRRWLLEVMASPLHTQGSGKIKPREQGGHGLHGFHMAAYLNLETLLFPGITRARVVGQLAYYNQQDVERRTGVDKSFFETLNIEPVSYARPKKLDGGRSGSKVATPPLTPDPGAPVALVDDAGRPLLVVVEVELLKPLVARRSVEQLTSSVSALIPPAPKLPQHIMAAQLAEEHYRQAVRASCELLAREFRAFAPISGQSDDDRLHKEFDAHLRESGAYQKLLETLRGRISTLVSEKCQDVTNLFSDLEMQGMVSSVYVYLVEEMHAVVNSLVDLGQIPASVPSQLTTDQLLYFSEEALEYGDKERADQFHLERISRDKSNPRFWLDYGVFCWRLGRTDKAVECVKESLSRDIRHLHSMLLYGMLLSERDTLQEAELFLEAATRFYPGTLEPWVVLHLFYLKTDNHPGADVTLHMIRKIMSGCQKMSRLSDSLSWSARLYENNTEFLCTAVMLLRMHALDFAEMALAQELLHHGPSTPYFYYISVCHYLGGEPGFAVPHMEDAVRKHGKDCSLWSLMGHCHYLLDAHDKAEECYRYVGESFDRPEDIHLVGLRLADYLMKHKDHRLAKKHYLEVCGVSPSPRSWLGAAVACYMLNELDDCERALAAANALDNTCPVTWGYLALVNLRYHRQPQFQQCLRQALRNRLKTKDEALMSRINALRESIGYPDPLAFSLNSKPA